MYTPRGVRSKVQQMHCTRIASACCVCADSTDGSYWVRSPFAWANTQTRRPLAKLDAGPNPWPTHVRHDMRCRSLGIPNRPRAEGKQGPRRRVPIDIQLFAKTGRRQILLCLESWCLLLRPLHKLWSTRLLSVCSWVRGCSSATNALTYQLHQTLR